MSEKVLEFMVTCICDIIASWCLTYLGSKEVPTIATIDSYMTKLHKIILDSPQENQELIVAVREVVSKLNLEAYVT